MHNPRIYPGVEMQQTKNNLVEVAQS